MAASYRNAVVYHYVRGSRTEERSYSFDYAPISPFPKGRTIEDVFRTAIDRMQSGRHKDVLTDLYRFLVFSNYARFEGNPGFRQESLRRLDSKYPSAHVLAEATQFDTGQHLSARTNTTGAVLYLLMHSRNPKGTNEILGGFLVSMLAHPLFTKPPRIHVAL